MNTFFCLSNITSVLRTLKVPSKHVTVSAMEDRAVVRVLIHKTHGNEVHSILLTAQALMENHDFVIQQLYKAALWYHGGSIPFRPHWWHSKNVAEQALCLWLLGFTLFVVLHIAKYLGWYK